MRRTVRRTMRRVAPVVAMFTAAALVATACTPNPDGWDPHDDPPPAVVVTPKDPDAVRVAVVGDSLLARDCWTCSPLAIPVYGGEEEIRPILDADPHIDLVAYSATPGSTLYTHPGLAAAIASAPDELIIDLHVNDAFQVGIGSDSTASVNGDIDAVLAQAEAAGVGCVRWISYPTRWTNKGIWTYVPGARDALLVIADHVRTAVAAHPGRAAMIEWGPLAEQLDDAGVPVIDRRDHMHYADSIAPMFGETIRRAVGTECARGG